MNFDEWVWCVRAQIVARAENMSHDEEFWKKLDRNRMTQPTVGEKTKKGRQALYAKMAEKASKQG